MTIDFYYHPGSAPCRAIIMTAKAVGVELNSKLLDLDKGEHLTPEFLAINPQHTIPTLIDNGVMLNESRAILTYLVDRYGKPDDPLYPRDAQKRATINQRLLFDMGTLYESFANYYYPVFYMGVEHADAELIPNIEKALAFFDTFLKDSQFAAGDTLTVADIALVASISTFCHLDGFQLKQSYPNVTRWFNKCKAVTPRYDLNVAGLKEYKEIFIANKDKFQ